MVLLVNQHTVPVFSDIVNAFHDHGEVTTLFTGHVEKGGRQLSSNIRVIKSIPYNRKSSATRILTWLIFTLHFSIYLIFCRKPQKILVCTNPPLAPIVTAWIASLRKIPFYIVLYDLYPEALFQAGLVQKENIISRTWARLNRYVFAKASRIFTLSESMKCAVSLYVPAVDKIKVIHNWADTSYIHPIERHSNRFASAHSLQDKFVVLYSGNMGLTHNLESLIEAAALLRHRGELVFVLIGDGGKRKALQRMVRDKRLSNVMFLPYQDNESFPLAMAAADIGVVTLGIGAEGISVPSKTYVNLAAGLCILSIAPKESELNRLVNEYDAGFTCVPGQPDDIARVIQLLLDEPQRLTYHKERSVKAATHFTPENASQYVEQTIAVGVTAQ